MQQELEKIWQEQRVTMIMVTHDIEEAITLADKIVVLAGGRGGIRQVIRVAMPRPRDRSCHEFGEVRGALLREFHLSAN